MRPHRRLPIRLWHPWDSPGKNTGVGCHFLLQCMKVKSESGVAQSCPTLSDPMDCSPPGSSVHGISQVRRLEWVAVSSSRGIFLAQQWNPCLLYNVLYNVTTYCCCQVTSVVSDSMRPHRWQPTRLPCPWDSPGKNTGVGCHFLLQCMKVKSESGVAQSCLTLHNPMDCSLQASLPMGFSRQEY